MFLLASVNAILHVLTPKWLIPARKLTTKYFNVHARMSIALVAYLWEITNWLLAETVPRWLLKIMNEFNFANIADAKYC